MGQRNQLGSAGLFRTRGCVRVAYQCIGISHVVYADHEKVEYFRRLAENPNVSVIAKEMGVLRVTCYTWAHKAGIFTSEARKVNPRKEEFLRHRVQGLTRPEAVARVDAGARSAANWDKCIAIIHRGRIYPDGRIVRYPKQEIASTKPERRSCAIGGKGLPRVYLTRFDASGLEGILRKRGGLLWFRA